MHAEVNEEGMLEPVMNELGEFVYVEDSSGQPATRAHTSDEPVSYNTV